MAEERKVSVHQYGIAQEKAQVGGKITASAHAGLTAGLPMIRFRVKPQFKGKIRVQNASFDKTYLEGYFYKETAEFYSRFLIQTGFFEVVA